MSAGEARSRTGVWVVAALAAAAAAVLLVPPIAQDQAYHRFADSRSFCGVPNGLNVLSNLAFLAAGLAGLAVVASERSVFAAGWERAIGGFFAAGVVLTGLGSAYYHAAPDDATLVWDRLPLALAFMALFVLVLADRLDARLARRWALPLLLLGPLGVLYWRLSDDLRLYGLAQFGPLVTMPALALVRTGACTGGNWLGAAFALYAAGKVFELADASIFAAGGIVSGHTLKHLTAAAAAAALVAWLALRTRR